MTQVQKSVMIVEDEAEARESLAAVLQSEGYRVIEAEHGVEALQHLRASTAVCIILLDLFMPTMNGWAFRDEQMHDPALAAIPVVVITADTAAARRAATLGVLEALTKPIDFDRLLTLVAKHC
jgi:CheY-like chemotaxis protein